MLKVFSGWRSPQERNEIRNRLDKKITETKTKKKKNPGRRVLCVLASNCVSREWLHSTMPFKLESGFCGDLPPVLRRPRPGVELLTLNRRVKVDFLASNGRLMSVDLH